jgi:3-hydroxybutyryl-CoA dehydrogenase
MKTVGVVGAGVMGTGVAQTLAQTGHRVRLVDLSRAVLDEALSQIEKHSRFSRMLGGPAVDSDAVLAAISTDVDLACLADCDFVIENITENWAKKRDLYHSLEDACSPETIFIANTSAIPITKIAAATRRRDKVVGVHFMNPVPMKPAAELIPGFHTSPQTVEATRDLLTAMGKRGIDVKDACGFVSNRVLMLTVNEAAYLVYEGVADANTVDDVFRSCFGHPMGPLETADLIGVDTILYSMEVLYEHYSDSKYRPCPLLRQMTDAELHGRKTGRGFHTYDSLGRVVPTPRTSVA